MAGTLSYENLEQKVKELENKLFEYEKAKDWLKLFSHSFESSIDGLAMGDLESRIIYANEAFANMFGYSREEVVGKEISFLYADDQLPLLKEVLHITMKGGWTGELIGRKKDGTLFPVSISSSRVLDENGNVITHIANHKDITQEKQTLEALRVSEEKWRSFVNTSRDAIYMVTRDGEFVDFNQSFLDLFGYTENEMSTIKAIDLYSDSNDRATFLREIEKNGSVKNYEVRLKKKDGAEIYVLNSATVRKAQDGSILGYQGIIRDTTEKKRAEKELQESEEKWRTVFEQSRDAISITARNGEFVDANQAFLDFFGYTKEEIQNSNSIERYTHPEDRERFFKEVEAKGSIKDFELKLRRMNGDEMITLCSSAVRRAPDGSIIGYQNMVRDITQQRKTLNALRESEAQKQAILDASVDRIRLSDTDMKIIWANQTHARELNIHPEELIGQHCYSVFVKRDTPCPECPSIKALTSGTIEHSHLSRPSIKNREKKTYLDSYAVPLKTESGGIESLIQITRNVTEQVQAEQDLRKSEEKYRSILESIEEGYYEVDLVGNFTFFNDSVCKMLGYSRDELLGMNNREFTNKKTAEKLYRAFNRVHKTGKSRNIIDQEIIRKSGSRRDIETSVALMKDSKGNATGFRGIFRDVTEHKRGERAVKKREKELAKLNTQLIETNRALSVLAKNLDITQKESEKRVVQKIRSYIIPIIEKLRQDKNIERYRVDFDLLASYIKDLTSDLADDIKIALALSNTELRVASLIRNGMTNQEIAKHMYITLSTVKTHRRNIRKKLDLHNSGINLKAYMKSELD